MTKLWPDKALAYFKGVADVVVPNCQKLQKVFRATQANIVYTTFGRSAAMESTCLVGPEDSTSTVANQSGGDISAFWGCELSSRRQSGPRT